MLNNMPDRLVREIYSNLLIDQQLAKQYSALFDHLRWTEQLSMLEAIFRDIEKQYFPAGNFSGDKMDLDQSIDSIAALCSDLISKRANLESQLVEWLSKGHGGSIQTIALKRAIIVNLAHDRGNVYQIESVISSIANPRGNRYYCNVAQEKSRAVG